MNSSTTRRVRALFFSIFDTRSAPISRVLATCVPPHGCRSTPSISRSRTRPRPRGGFTDIETLTVSGGLDVSRLAGPITVTLTGTGSIAGFQLTATGMSGTFNNITTLTGSAGADTLIGTNANSTWGLDGTPTYSSGGQTLNFSGFDRKSANRADCRNNDPATTWSGPEPAKSF